MNRRAWVMLAVVLASGGASIASALAVDGQAAAAEWSIHTVRARAEAGAILIEALEILAGEEESPAMRAAMARFAETTRDNPVQVRAAARILSAADAVEAGDAGAYRRLRDAVDLARAEEDRLLTLRLRALHQATARAASVAWGSCLIAGVSVLLICLVGRHHP